MAKTKSFTDVRTFSDDHKWEDDLDWQQFKDGRREIVRFVGDPVVMARHWIETLRGKVFPMWCTKFDPDRETFTLDMSCPMHDDFDKNASKVIIVQGIVRSRQERGEENPIRAFLFPHGISKDLQNIMERLNSGKGASVSDPVKGCDLSVLYDSSVKGGNKWSIQRDETTPLTDAEKEYTLFNFETMIPDYSDPEVGAVQARAMKDAMANHKWYVTPLNSAGDKKGWARYKGDVAGEPYNNFADLADLRDNDNRGGGGGGGKSNDRKPRRTLDDDIDDIDSETPARSRKVESKASDDASDGDDSATDMPARFKSHASWVSKFGVEFKGDNPTCYSGFDGGKKCQGCPVKADCIEAISEE